MSETHKKSQHHRNWRAGRNLGSPKSALRGFGLVEKMFYYYPRIKREVETIRSEQGYYQSGCKEGGGSSNHAFISDPTFQMAERHLKPISRIIFNADKIDEESVSRPEDWMLVVEQTIRFFDTYNPVVSDVLKRRFLKNEPLGTTCVDTGISYDLYYKRRNEGVAYARECAIQLGLIKVF